MPEPSTASERRQEGGKRPTFWRNSTYEEPTWVSVAWIVGPMVLAAIAVYFALS